MGKRKQHPLITAMNKFDALLAGLDSSNAEAFTAYVRNKVATRPSKSSAPAPRARNQSSSGRGSKGAGEASTLTETAGERVAAAGSGD